MTSPDLTQANIETIATMFPCVITETMDEEGNIQKAVDFDLLRQELSDHIVEGPQERYRLEWPGKRTAMFAANAPTAKTLRPVKEKSIDFDRTKNLFIEGDNLEALKLLQESYLAKVKLIYIDPPYNTGSDFVYSDDYSMTSMEYLAKSGQIDQVGARLVANTESNGRIHSDWLSMIYARLRLARNLLTEDGYIVVSIDDSEFAGLKLLMDEVFGSANQLAVLVWDRNRKNDARYFSVGHEYMLVYARNKTVLDEAGIKLREPQPGIDEAKKFYDRLLREFSDDWVQIRASWRKYCASFPADDERRKLGRFTKVGPRGPYRDDGDISWPGGGGPKYEVLHPVTGKPVKIPNGGWIYSKPATFHESVLAGRVVFGSDESTLPRQVRYLFESPGLVMRSVHYSYAQTSAKDFQRLMGARVFDNPKSWRDLRRLIGYLTDPDDIVMDFFAGSGSTAHAVMDLNAAEGSARKFILVQIAEAIAERSVAADSGYETIVDIATDRLRRAAEEIALNSGSSDSSFDAGFRFLRLDSSNLVDVYRSPDATSQLNLNELLENLKSDRSGEDLLFQVLLDMGLDLSMEIVTEHMDGQEVFVVEDDALLACFEPSVSLSVVRSMAKRKPLSAVFRDSGFASDHDRINAEQIFHELSPATDVRAV